MRTLSSFLGIFTAATLILGACSSSAPTDGSSNPNSNTSGNQPGQGGGGGSGAAGQYSCCLNDVYYACGDKAAFDKCIGFDFGACDAKCGLSDFQCHQSCMDQATKASHDPSACTRQSGACPSGGGGGGGGPLCTNIGGAACTYDTQCGAGKHCTDGHCYTNESGSKCQYDTQCGSSNHCTDGCCQGNTSGTTCQYDTQCGSGNHCTDGKCYANRAGSPCQYDTQCGSSGNCTNGRCQ